jgi:phosphatidylinositol glycan class B
MFERNGATAASPAKWPLILIITGAIIIRLVIAIASDNLNHPDENFQILEQAHRAVFGYGLIPWEFRYAARSWITPGFAVLALYPLKLLGWDNPNFYIPLIRVILAFTSVIIIISAYHLGKKMAGMRAGLWAAFFCGVWYEVIYFSIRPLSEVWAATLFIAALALSYKERSVTRQLLASFLACLAIAIRVHYLPLIIILLLFNIVYLNKKALAAFLISMAVSVTIIAAFEMMSWGRPLITHLNYYRLNQSFSMAPDASSIITCDYIIMLGYSSLFVSWLILMTGALFWKKTGFLLLSVLSVLLTHSLIPLKEYIISIRFVYVVIPMILIIGGISVAAISKKFQTSRSRKLFYGTVGAIILTISAAGAFDILPLQNSVYRHSIFYRDPCLKAYRYMNSQSNLVGIYDDADFWFSGGGYYYLHRNIPLYYGSNPPSSPDYISHIITREKLDPSSGFGLIKSFGDLFIYARKDKDFNYKVDSAYSPNMFQPGIDDRFDKSKIFLPRLGKAFQGKIIL